MCWNYRNYGNSSSPILKGINPFNIKIDAEKVLDFVINRLKIKGKIGVYGRSLGGITSCHLANKFPNLISTLIVDRTFCEFDQLSSRRLTGRCTKFLYKLVSYNWKALNDRNFIEAKCFKILTCDPLDDVVDNYSALNVGVAMKYAVKQYDEPKWKQFFDSLYLMHEIEDNYFYRMKEYERENLKNRLSSISDVKSEKNSNPVFPSDQSPHDEICTINDR